MSSAKSNNCRPLRVRQFVSNDPAAAARELEQWLESFEGEVCQLAQSQGERQGRFLFVITVLYE
ncbi:MAG: hypothetical protein EOO12_04445 [Chitinophagaceae bacterium]|nr:MAG: hypothetical protein EOO12_04445 [Chitinophagaceae bacterium]